MHFFKIGNPIQSDQKQYPTFLSTLILFFVKKSNPILSSSNSFIHFNTLFWLKSNKILSKIASYISIDF